jgi:hypothetical protein
VMSTWSVPSTSTSSPAPPAAHGTNAIVANGIDSFATTAG